MANPHRGAVALEAGEKVYSLRFTTNSICELEDHFDRPITQIVNDMQDESRISMKTVRALVWGALLDAHPEVTTKQAGEILDEAGSSVVMEKIGEAMKRFFPDQEGEGKENPPKAPAKK